MPTYFAFIKISEYTVTSKDYIITLCLSVKEGTWCLLVCGTSFFLLLLHFYFALSPVFQLKQSLMRENERWSLFGQFSGFIISGVDTSSTSSIKGKLSAEVWRVNSLPSLNYKTNVSVLFVFHLFFLFYALYHVHVIQYVILTVQIFKTFLDIRINVLFLNLNSTVCNILPKGSSC